MVFEDNKPLVVQLMELHANGMKKCKHFLMKVAYKKEQVSKPLITTIEKIPTRRYIVKTHVLKRFRE
jgi:hypothetical protein